MFNNKGIVAEFAVDYPALEGQVFFCVYSDDLWNSTNAIKNLLFQISEKEKKPVQLSEELVREIKRHIDKRRGASCKLEDILGKPLQYGYVMGYNPNSSGLEILSFLALSTTDSWHDKTIDTQIMHKFVYDHEIAHAVAHAYDYPYAQDKDPENIREHHADAYAILRMIRKHGAKGVEYAKAIADVRSIAPINGAALSHYTTPAIEKAISLAINKGLGSLFSISTEKLFYLAASIADETAFTSEQIKKFNSFLKPVIGDGMVCNHPATLQENVKRIFDLGGEITSYIKEYRNAIQRRIKVPKNMATEVHSSIHCDLNTSLTEKIIASVNTKYSNQFYKDINAPLLDYMWAYSGSKYETNWNTRKDTLAEIQKLVVVDDPQNDFTINILGLIYGVKPDDTMYDEEPDFLSHPEREKDMNAALEKLNDIEAGFGDFIKEQCDKAPEETHERINNFSRRHELVDLFIQQSKTKIIRTLLNSDSTLKTPIKQDCMKTPHTAHPAFV